MLSGCQDELVEIDQPPAEQVVSVNSTITNLVSRVALNDGSNDNIIDNSSCTSILLPITVNVNGQEITLNSEEDFEVVEMILDELEDDEDTLTIIFPITAIFADHSELLITDEDMLEDLAEECEQGEDEDIECLDFKYPITFSVFDSNKQTADIVTINNDKDLFTLFEAIDEGDLVGFDFPVTMVLYNQEEVVVNDNNQLEELIESSIDACDEKDNEVSVLFAILISNQWEVTLFSDITDETADFDGYKLTFVSSGLVTADDGAEVVEGEWEIKDRQSQEVLRLKLDFEIDTPPLLWLIEDWEIVDYSEVRIEMKEESETEGFEKMLTIEII